MTRRHFCAAPWSGLSLQPNGQARACCVSHEETEFVSVEQLKTDHKFVEIRDAIMLDQRHDNCQACWSHEDRSMGEWTSRRAIYQPGDYYHDLSSNRKFELQHLDLRWNNTCNLNCVYCNAHFSSRWAKLLGVEQRLRNDTVLSDQTLTGLKVLQMAGGEPLLIKPNQALLERLLAVNPGVEIEVTTNLTSVKHNAVYELLTQFRRVSWVVSFESTGARFEYIRHGADWLGFNENFKTLIKDFQQVQCSMIYFPLSAGGINDAIMFALDHVDPQQIFIRAQEGGHGFDMLARDVVQYLKFQNTQFCDTLPEVLKNRFMPMINSVNSSRHQTSLPNYDKFDSLTSQNHRLVFPELYH